MKMENISILDKAECCGCTACYSICPTRAIEMSPDEEGFLYPAVDEKKCISCGLCLKTCKQDTQYKNKQKIYAVKSKDLDLRFNSSSGGGCFHYCQTLQFIMAELCVALRLMEI